MITYLRLERLSNPKIGASPAIDGEHQVGVHANPVLEEEVFLRTLTVERKRTERSGNPFALLLVDFLDLAAEEMPSLKIVEGAIESSIRDIDVAGWYSTGKCLGVIRAGIGPKGQEEDCQQIVSSIRSKLQMAVGAALANKINVSVLLFPGVSGSLSQIENMHFYPDLHVVERNRRGALFLKRCMDIAGSLAALIVLSPVFLAIAILVKLTSRGPVLFKQMRIGRYGKPFTFLKFRSMYADNDPKIHQEYVAKLIAGKAEKSESGEKVVYKIKNDPRVTRIGHFLRRSSLDELPQFLNVLIGEMSLVGPRPPVPYEFEQYNLWHRRRSLEVKPGITGLWQVSGRSRTSFDEMVRLDLHYAGNWSIWWDIKILLSTPKAVFTCDGAY